MNSSNFTFAEALTTGYDLRFAKSDGTHLNYNRERHDDDNDLAEYWVLCDTIQRRPAVDPATTMTTTSTATKAKPDAPSPTRLGTPGVPRGERGSAYSEARVGADRHSGVGVRRGRLSEVSGHHPTP